MLLSIRSWYIKMITTIMITSFQLYSTITLTFREMRKIIAFQYMYFVLFMNMKLPYLRIMYCQLEMPLAVYLGEDYRFY